MILLYTILCVSAIYLSYRKYKKILNPLSLYIFIWLLNVLLYELKLIKYNSLTYKTWVILFLNIIFFSLGIFMKKRSCSLIEEKFTKDNMIRIILFLCVLSGIAIFPNLFFCIKRYGINLLKMTTYIYADNVSGNGINTIPYLGSLAMLGVLFSSTYFKLYGFNKYLLLPYIMVILDILPTGSRGNLILVLVMSIIPFIFSNSNSKKKSKKQILILSSICLVFVMFYSIFTYNRRPDTPNDPYVTDEMVEINNYVPLFHKSYEYFTSPVGVLNEYLKKPRFIFGINTFSVERNILNKFGIPVRYEHTQPVYETPLPTNVGTWVKDFYEDFTVVGLFLCLFGIAYLLDKLYISLEKGIVYQVLFNFLSMLVYLSWFYFFMRQGSVTIMLFGIVGITLFLYKKCFFKNLKKE